MSTVIRVTSRLRVHVHVLPGSARIQASFGQGRGPAVMYDPIFRQWHRAGYDHPDPTEWLRLLARGQLRRLEARLQAFHQARMAGYDSRGSTIDLTDEI